MKTDIDLSVELTKYIDAVSFDALPQLAIENAKYCLLEVLGAILIGSQADYIQSLGDSFAASNTDGPSTVIGRGTRKAMENAAFLNGSACTVKEFVGGHRQSYCLPAIAIFPAAISVAEALHCSGKEFIEAVVAAYDVQARVGMASVPIRYTFHPHGTLSTLGAAVAAGRLKKMRGAEMVNLLNVASVLPIFAHRRTTFEGKTVRNVYPGFAAYNGVLAADLSRCGIEGADNGVVSCFAEVFTDKFNEDLVLDQLGERYEITRNYFKPHACDRHLHGAIDVTGLLIEKYGRDVICPENIEKITVHTYFRAFKCSTKEPHNVVSAQWSIPHGIAARIILDDSGFDAFSAEAVWNPAIRRLAAKVDVFEDPAYTAEDPEISRKTKLTVTLNSGENLTMMVDHPKGDPENPCSHEELENKFRKTVQPVLQDDQRIEQIITMVQNLTGLDDMSQLIKML